MELLEQRTQGNWDVGLSADLQLVTLTCTHTPAQCTWERLCSRLAHSKEENVLDGRLEDKGWRYSRLTVGQKEILRVTDMLIMLIAMMDS